MNFKVTRESNLRTCEAKFIGDWRIVEMPDLDQEDVDMEVPAFINFKKKGHGSFQFASDEDELDARFDETKG